MKIHITNDRYFHWLGPENKARALDLAKQTIPGIKWEFVLLKPINDREHGFWHPIYKRPLDVVDGYYEVEEE